MCVFSIISIMFYASEAWPVNVEMTKLINSFATSAYRVMTGVRRLDRVHNNTVLASVSRRELIYTLQSRQLYFLGHLLRSERALYALYEPQHGSARRGRPRTNFIYSKTDRTAIGWADEFISRPRRLETTCGRRCLLTTPRLEEEEEDLSVMSSCKTENMYSCSAVTKSHRWKPTTACNDSYQC